MATNFSVKLAKSAYSTLFIALAFENGLQCCTSDLKRFICDDLATWCKHLVDFGLIALRVSEGERYTFLVDQQFVYVRLVASLLDLEGISTEFSGAITTQFCFTYTLEGVTAMPCGLHARLCHAFLVVSRPD